MGIRFMWMIFLLITFKILLNKCCWSSQNTEIIKDKSFLKYFFKCLFSWINHCGTFRQGKACSIPAMKTVVAFFIWTRNKWQVLVVTNLDTRVNLWQQFIENLSLVTYIPILIVFLPTVDHKTSSVNNSWEEDFNSVITIPGKYFLTNN